MLNGISFTVEARLAEIHFDVEKYMCSKELYKMGESGPTGPWLK